MRHIRLLVLGPVLLGTLAVGNVSLIANGCGKDCGAGPALNRGERFSEECGEDPCFWVQCGFAGCGPKTPYPECSDHCYTFQVRADRVGPPTHNVFTKRKPC